LTLQIGLVGVGPWGAHVLRDLRELGAIVHGVARSPESIKRAEQGGAASIVQAPQQLPPCDGYVIANRTMSHLDAVDVLLPRGRPIFCEKPISSDVARTKNLPPEAERLVFIMHKWRYHPGIIELARIAESERFGPVEGLRTHRLSWTNPHADANTLWVLAPHELSIALAIFGEVPQVVNAAAGPMDETGAVAYLRTKSGIPFVMECSFGNPVRLRRIMLRCRDAVCVLDDSDYASLAIRRTGAQATERLSVGDDMPLLTELRAFVDHLAGGPPPLSSLADEIKIIEAIAQIEATIAAQ
jgi:predicted dehydrogenase